MNHDCTSLRALAMAAYFSDFFLPVDCTWKQGREITWRS